MSVRHIASQGCRRMNIRYLTNSAIHTSFQHRSQTISVLLSHYNRTFVTKAEQPLPTDESPLPMSQPLCKKQRSLQKKEKQIEKQLAAIQSQQTELKQMKKAFRNLQKQEIKKQKSLAKKAALISEGKEARSEARRKAKRAKKEAEKAKIANKLEARRQKERKAMKVQTQKETEMSLLKSFPDPNCPKRPASPYALFWKQYSEEMHQTEGKEKRSFLEGSHYMKRASDQWKNEMTTEEKSSFVEQSLELQSKYKILKSFYDSSNSREKWLITAQQLKDSRPGTKGGWGVYFKQEFTKRYMPGRTLDDSRQEMKEISANWRAMSEEERQSYRDMASKDFQDWLQVVNSYYKD